MGDAAACRVQALARGTLVRASLATEIKARKKRLKQMRNRKRVVMEMVSTEETYNESLKIMIEFILTPLKWNAENSPQPTVTKEDLTIIFSNIEQIQGLSSQLLAKLKEKEMSWDANQTIADVFMHFMPFFKMYTIFINNFDNANNKLGEVEKKERFKQFWEPIRMLHNVGTIGSFLIMPVQRIPRYVLLLRELIKNTWDEHPDLAHLNAAQKKVQEIGGHVNAALGANGDLEEAHAYFGAYVTILAPARKLVKKGPLTWCKQKQTREEVVVWLFNDLMVVSSEVHAGGDDLSQSSSLASSSSSSSSQVTSYDYLAHSYLTEEGQVKALLKDLTDLEFFQFTFQLSSQTAAFTLQAAGAVEKDGWIVAIRQQLQPRKMSLAQAQMALSAAPSLVEATIVGTKELQGKGKKYTVYRIKLEGFEGGQVELIYKRYSEFHKLSTLLRKTKAVAEYATAAGANTAAKAKAKSASVVSMPPKQVYGNTSAKAVESRRVGLTLFLQSLLMQTELVRAAGAHGGNKDIRSFFGAHSLVINSSSSVEEQGSKSEEVVEREVSKEVPIFLAGGGKLTVRCGLNCRADEMVELVRQELGLQRRSVEGFGIFCTWHAQWSEGDSLATRESEATIQGLGIGGHFDALQSVGAPPGGVVASAANPHHYDQEGALVADLLASSSGHASAVSGGVNAEMARGVASMVIPLGTHECPLRVLRTRNELAPEEDSTMDEMDDEDWNESRQITPGNGAPPRNSATPQRKRSFAERAKDGMSAVVGRVGNTAAAGGGAVGRGSLVAVKSMASMASMGGGKKTTIGTPGTFDGYDSLEKAKAADTLKNGEQGAGAGSGGGGADASKEAATLRATESKLKMEQQLRYGEAGLLFQKAHSLRRAESLDPNTADPALIPLLQRQARRDLIAGAFPCSQSEAVKLAALHLQAEQGDYSKEKSFFGRHNLKYIPPHHKATLDKPAPSGKPAALAGALRLRYYSLVPRADYKAKKGEAKQLCFKLWSPVKGVEKKDLMVQVRFCRRRCCCRRCHRCRRCRRGGGGGVCGVLLSDDFSRFSLH
jgi:hypothetical protein